MENTPTELVLTGSSIPKSHWLLLWFDLAGYSRKLHEYKPGTESVREVLELEVLPYREVTKTIVEADPRAGLRQRVVKTIAYEEVIEREGLTPQLMLSGSADAYVSKPSFSPDGKFLLFSIHEPTTTGAEGLAPVNLYRFSGEGSGLQQITHGRFTNIDPAYSADGKFIYFASNRRGTDSDLVRVPTGATPTITLLTQSDASDREPCCGKNGEIAYSSYVRGGVNPQIWILGRSGNYPTQLREGRSPSLSPDGTRIAFIGVDKKLWVMTAAGDEQTQLTSTADSEEDEPAWSPDGAWLAFVSNSGKDGSGRPNNDIWAIEMSTLRHSQLTTNGSDDRSPVFTPDGKFVVFVSNRGYKWNIWRIPFALK